MSVPPQLIRVKRKATEDAPVSYLRFQEGKRHRSEVFVYRRQDQDAAFAPSIPHQIQKPIIHTSHPHTQSAAFQNTPKENTQQPNPTTDGVQETLTTSHDVPANSNGASVGSNTEPRCFHMSRKDMMLAASPYPTRSHTGVSKKRSAPTLFVERKIKRISSRTVEKLHAAGNVSTSAQAAAVVAEDSMEVDRPEPKRYKKPGVAKLASKDDASKYKAGLPKSITERWNVDADKLAADMDAYAIEQIGLNLKKAEEEKKKEEAARNTPSKLRFKPKPPAKRYAERHANEPPKSVDEEMVDADDDIVSDSDDSEYIIETYVRMPASKMGSQVPPQSVGLLVFDDEPDIEYFYGEGDESEEEWAEDEEDENAENYYAADYPDEEVASDDEYNRNAYSYRNGNASDLEEFGLGDDSDGSTDHQDSNTQFRTYIGRNGLKSNHL
ncbi:hypothetical protein F5Y15DRAFT_378816 [Xylariaceae sp. FL0016]|nr:hypothetical protein F5Y15DRAFT_378816 [Xylariaceae sp. FL0016]